MEELFQAAKRKGNRGRFLAPRHLDFFKTFKYFTFIDTGKRKERLQKRQNQQGECDDYNDSGGHCQGQIYPCGKNR